MRIAGITTTAKLFCVPHMGQEGGRNRLSFLSGRHKWQFRYFFQWVEWSEASPGFSEASCNQLVHILIYYTYLLHRQVIRAGLGLDEVNRRVRDSLSTLADVALEVAWDERVRIFISFFVL